MQPLKITVWESGSNNPENATASIISVMVKLNGKEISWVERLIRKSAVLC